MENETLHRINSGSASPIKRILLFCCFLLGFFLVGSPQADAQITGPNKICSGLSTSFGLTGTPNPAYTYTWTVTPPGNATILTSSGSGSTIQWISPVSVAGMIIVTINRPSLPDTVWTHSVNIVAEPNPQITTNTILGCQGVEGTKGEEDLAASTPINVKGTIIDDGACIKVCQRSTVKYEVVGGQAGSTYQWNIDPAKGYISGSSTSSSIQVYWDNTLGFTFVKVKETTGAGCVKEKTVCVRIIESPDPKFSINGTTLTAEEYEVGKCLQACIQEKIQFSDLTPPSLASPLVAWQWDFGDGTFSSLQNPQHDYANPGNYTVTLKVTNQCGCVGIYSVCIEVAPPENMPVQIQCPSLVCENTIGHYTIENDCDAMTWTVKGGTIKSSSRNNVDILWNNAGPSGFGEIIADFSDCGGRCSPKVIALVPVIQTNGTISGKTIVCQGKQYKYQLPKWPATNFKWSVFPAGNAVIVGYSQNSYEVNIQAYAPFTLHCEYVNTLMLCSGKADLNINVIYPMTLNAPAKACFGTTTSVVSTSPSAAGTTYKFIDPNGTTSLSGVFDVIGMWTVEAVNPGFCDIEPVSIMVVDLPEAVRRISGEARVCAGTNYVYEVINPMPNTICTWSIVSGTFVGSNTGNSVIVKWNAGAGISRSLSVRRYFVDPSGGCMSALTNLPVNLAVPTAYVSGNTNPCANTTATYTATLTAGPVDNVFWSLSNPALGSVSEGQNTLTPTITWNNTSAASTPCTLIATLTKCDSPVRILYPVSVIGIPSVTVTPSDYNPCSGTPVLFNITTIPAGASLNWTTSGLPVASPSSGTAATPSIVFTNLDNVSLNQNATLTVNASAPGCLMTGQGYATVAVKPQPNINVSPGGSGSSGTIMTCNPVNVPLLLSTNPGSSISWYHNTGSIPATQVNPATATGTYRVDVTGPNGCSSSMTRIIALDPLCGTSPCTVPPLAAGATSRATMILCANDEGEAIADVDFFNVYGTLGAGGTIAEIEVSSNSSYCMIPSSVLPLVPPNIPVHGIKISKPGVYIIELRVGYLTSSGDICNHFVRQDLTVPVIADFDFTTNCAGGAYTLTLNEQSPVLTNYFVSSIPTWTINSNLVSNPANIDLSVYTPGTILNIEHSITVSKTGFPPYTCKRTKKYIVPAAPKPAFSITTTDPLGPGTSSCAGREVIFTNLNYNGVTRWNWNFGDATGYVSTTLPARATRTYANPNPAPFFDYEPVKVILTLNDAFGCSFTKSEIFNLYKNKLTVSAYALPEDVKCEGTASSISITPGNGYGSYDYAWFREDAALGLLGNPVSVTQNGLYWTRITDARGCQYDANPVAAKRVFQPLPDVAISGEHDYCPGQAIKLNGINGTTTGLTYQWQQLAGATWINIAGATTGILEMPYGLGVGMYQYRIVIDQSLPSPYTGACSAVSPSFMVTVHGLPNVPVIAGPSVLDCVDYSLQLEVASPEAGVVYNWSNGTAGTSTVINHGGPYRVWATNTWGCKNKADIEVPLAPSAYFWRFPQGCYSFCEEQLPRQVDGPKYATFAQWEWWIAGSGLPFPNGGWASSGSSSTVDPLHINIDRPMGGDGNGSGIYQWFLDNGLCSQTSEPMSIQIKDQCCRADGEWAFFNCVFKDGERSYYGGLNIHGGPECTPATYTVYAIDVTSGSPSGTVTPSSGVYTAGSTISFSYKPSAGTGNHIRFQVVINCGGTECIATPETLWDFRERPCVDMGECSIDRKWHYFNCTRPESAAAPFFNGVVTFSDPFDCGPTAYLITAVDPVSNVVNGIVIPSSGIVFGGTSSWNINYYPNASVTAVKFVITFICDGKICTATLGEFFSLEDRTKYPCSAVVTVPVTGLARNTKNTPGAGGSPTMLIAPNPASSIVQISYVIPDWKDGDNSQILIVNLLGQPVAGYTVTGSNGAWQYATLQMIPGTYLVRLIKEGRTVDVQNMIVVH